MSDFFDQLADGFCCVHKQDVPQVEAVIRIVLPVLEDYWRQLEAEIATALVRELQGLDDGRGFPEVDAIGLERADRRDDLLRDLLLALLASLELRTAAPPPEEVMRVVRRAAGRLLARGASAIGEPLDLARAPLLQPGAEQELVALMRGRIELRRQEIEAHVRLFLTTRAPRTSVPGSLALTPSGRPESFEQWLRELHRLLGRDTSSWLPFAVDHWAYRWYSVGSFIAGRQNGVLAFRARAVRDSRTTPFCRWVDGRLIDVARSERQIQRHVALALRGDVQGLIQNWPLLDPKVVRGSNTDQFAREFRRVGLPPYHGRCRTVPVPVTL